MVLATVPEAPPEDEEPAGDFLSSADFGEGTELGRIEIEGECFMVSVEFLSGRHRQAPVGRPSKRREESVTS